ncbi:PAS domain-containing protein [Winogradskyella sp. PC D3.3]
MNDKLEEIALLQSIAHIGSWYWNLQTGVTNWSDEFYRILGLKPGDERLTNTSFVNFIHPDDREKVIKIRDTAIQNKHSYNYETRILRLDGTVKYISARGKFKTNDDGIPMCFLGTIQDISAFKKTEEKLLNSKIRNKAILKALPDIIYVFNSDGIYVEVYAEDFFLTNLSRNELIGKPINEVLPEDLSIQILSAFKRAEMSKEIQIINYSFSTNKQLKHIEIRVVVKENGNFLTIIRDITSTKNNELRVKESEERFRLSMLATHDGFYDFNPATNKGWYSQKYKDLFKPTNEPDWWESHIHPNDKDAVFKTIRLALNSNYKYWTTEYRFIHNDSSWSYVEDRGYIVRDEQGRATRVLGAVSDITKQKKEEILKEKVNRILEMITLDKPIKAIGNCIVKTIENHIDNCMASIFVLNEDHKTLHKLAALNLPKKFCDNFEGVLIGDNVAACGTAAFEKNKVIVSDIANDPRWEKYKTLALVYGLNSCWSFPILSSSERVLGTFSVYCKTKRLPTKSENESITDMVQLASVAIEQHNDKIKLEANKRELKKYAESLEAKVEERTHELKATVQQLVESNINLEDQILITKLAENKTLESQLMFSTIAKNFPKGFVAVFDSNFTIAFIEGEELDVLGMRNFAKGSTIDEIKVFPKDVRDKVKSKIINTFKGEHCSFEIEFEGRVYLINSTPLFNKDKHIQQVLLVHNNISDQKEVEQNIQNALKKEQELNQLKSQFISTASHEFRTPLSVILSSSILIEKLNTVGNEEKRLKHVDKIKVNVRNLVGILNDFLSLSKLEEGKVASQPEFFDMLSFSNSIIQDINLNKKKGQKIKLIKEVSELTVYLDPKLMRHILFNLLSNAVKYSPENTDITLIINSDKTYVILEILDEGIGIPKSEHKNIFHRFFRASNATDIQGTGLGLNIVKQYTELMDGVIHFKSELNKGTSFKIKLPLNNK